MQQAKMTKMRDACMQIIINFQIAQIGWLQPILNHLNIGHRIAKKSTDFFHWSFHEKK